MVGKKKERLDKLLVSRGLAGSRERARALILAGQVVVGDHTVDKAGASVDGALPIRVKGSDIPFVSRGGVKLQGALEDFSVAVTDRVALDVGASTGGFTDCLLQRGACLVYSVDVGYGQLAWKLRQDSRVVNLERTDVRNLLPGKLQPPPTLAVIDASFISLGLVLPPTLRLLDPPREVVALIKPQFEVGKGRVGKGGIVRDPELHRAVLDKIKVLAEGLGCRVEGMRESSLAGTKGNQEFFIHLFGSKSTE